MSEQPLVPVAAEPRDRSAPNPRAPDPAPQEPTVSSTFVQQLRTTFLAGILVTVPIGVTLFVLFFLVGQVDALQPHRLIGRPIPGLGIVLVTAVVLGVGLATRHWVGRRAVAFAEGLFTRVPVMSGVYRGVKQVVEAALSRGSGSVQGVVLVEWPRKGTWSVGFHTGDAAVVSADGARMINVFIPSTPNPTTGFYFMVSAEEVVFTELSVEDAAKMLMSAGIVSSDVPLRLPGAWGLDLTDSAPIPEVPLDDPS